MLALSVAFGLLLALGVAGCRSSHFIANDQDRRRLDALSADPAVQHVRGRAGSGRCVTELARYRKGSGEPLDFGGVDDSRVRCALPVDPPTATQARIVTADVVHAAASSGWIGVMDIGVFVMDKQITGMWSTMRLSVSTRGVDVAFSTPSHGRRGFAPAAVNVEAARTCVTTLLAAQPSPSCAVGP